MTDPRPAASRSEPSAFDGIVKTIVRGVSALVVVMGAVVVLATGELAWLSLTDCCRPPCGG
jgi:hypothetical protein